MSDESSSIDYNANPSASIYGYRPDEVASIAFIVVFSILALGHVILASRYKYWIVYPTLVCGCIGEVIGWSGRLWSNRNLNTTTPYMMQIASLIISPVFFSAFLYTMLGNAVERLNPIYCMLTSRTFVAIFLTADIISLILQAVGGGWAASVVPSPDAASNIMLGGIAFQLGIMVIFVVIGLDFCFRIWKDKPYQSKVKKLVSGREEEEGIELGNANDNANAGASANGARRTSQTSQNSQTNLKERAQISQGENPSWTRTRTGTGTGTGISRGWWMFMLAMLISSITIIVRGIYRTMELAQGWDGELIKEEGLQVGLDGIMMIVAAGVFIPAHMGFLLPRKSTWKGTI